MTSSHNKNTVRFGGSIGGSDEQSRENFAIGWCPQLNGKFSTCSWNWSGANYSWNPPFPNFIFILSFDAIYYSIKKEYVFLLSTHTHTASPNNRLFSFTVVIFRRLLIINVSRTHHRASPMTRKHLQYQTNEQTCFFSLLLLSCWIMNKFQVADSSLVQENQKKNISTFNEQTMRLKENTNTYIELI